MFGLHECLCTVCAWCLRKTEEGILELVTVIATMWVLRTKLWFFVFCFFFFNLSLYATLFYCVRVLDIWY